MARDGITRRMTTGPISWVVAAAFISVLSVAASQDDGACSPPLFVFGASLVDVGQNSAALPFHSYSEFLPYGQDFFGKPAKRFSNGRLFIDFISEALGQVYLTPYLQLYTGSYHHGLSFASSGSTALNSTLSGSTSFNGLFDYSSNGLFSLLVQIAQFVQFKNSVDQDDAFSMGVYIIETANNDYLTHGFKSPGFDSNTFVATVLETMEASFKILYREGARHVVVVNNVPLGCTPIILGTSLGTTDALDELGCVAKYNKLAQLHNEQLESLIERVNKGLPEPAFFVFDIYRVFVNAIRNPSAYGLLHVLKSCCGYGGDPYNYSDAVHCAGYGYVGGVLTASDTCPDPSTHLFWDSFHPTETFNRHISNAFMIGDFMKPKFVIRGVCDNANPFSRHKAGTNGLIENYVTPTFVSDTGL